MHKRGRTLLLVFIVLAAAVFLFARADTDGPPYAPFSTATLGTSVFFDTLRHMGYPVRIHYAPLTTRTDTAHVIVIIQPFNPAVSPEMAEEMLAWVYAGGRLIFLHNAQPSPIDLLLQDRDNVTSGGFFFYRVGAGEVITGRAHPLTNQRLLNDSTPGAVLQEIIAQWDATRIYFTAYYHGMHPPDTLFAQLPVGVRLVIVQLGLAALMLIWCLGKRFGKPVPAYEEVEREENEQVRALARLYMKIGRND